ncbi:hypothetical protein GCK72_019514 [Caenorhabditis remanei]|uniref:Uncharacterized protein n=1 Tax=Caenorhabditis remanei TaxID=31234 RepID=A0A6A5GEU6_CAERE|nr:hypothetical protein GCK72_019514 [Caenorhabditis remanei]KAF1752959.1 hypothetical protein GCK72_019514 [Caenorhabditis remanei]
MDKNHSLRQNLIQRNSTLQWQSSSQHGLSLILHCGRGLYNLLNNHNHRSEHCESKSFSQRHCLRELSLQIISDLRFDISDTHRKVTEKLKILSSSLSSWTLIS